MKDKRCKPDLKVTPKTNTVGKKFTVKNSYYVDDAAFILLSREDVEAAAKLIKSHFRRFGLTVHSGDKRDAKPESKTEAMFIPGHGCETTAEETADIMITENEYFGYCTKFKYLGTTFDSNLNDSTDIKARIQKATGAFAKMS